jgi:hypothetical protein
MWTLEPYGDLITLNYKLDNLIVIQIGTNIISDKFKYGAVIHNTPNYFEYVGYCQMFENNLKVLKFKCLLLAKQKGWSVDIKDI